MICNYFKQEYIPDFQCEKCKKRGINKSHNIIEFPHYLIVLVKRFIYFPEQKKLENKIDFKDDTTLDLCDFYCDFTSDKTSEG